MEDILKAALDETSKAGAKSIREIHARIKESAVQLLRERKYAPPNPCPVMLASQKAVKAACELLGFDPLYVANEGKLATIVPGANARSVLAAMRHNQYGVQSDNYR